MRGNSLNDPDLSHEINEDLIYITRKIYIRNLFKIIRLILQILFIVYFLGQYWFIFVDVFNSIHENEMFDAAENYYNEEDDHAPFFFKNKKWDISRNSGGMQTITAMYYALTTLSTTGLGDFHPITDKERLLGIVLIFFGVIMFSYILGELRFLISNIDSLNGEIEYNDELDNFFLLLTKFNYGNQIDIELQNLIRNFMNLKWKNDKNSFLKTEQDQNLLDQLPDSSKIMLYTDFIFKDFIWKFRRFFRFNRDNIQEFTIMKKDCKRKLTIYKNKK